MSNDVHLAKVSRIPRQTDAVKSLVTGNNRHFDNRMTTLPTQDQGLAPDLIDSPDTTQRDTTTESDNNVSSCSTLDIVNKVSDLQTKTKFTLNLRNKNICFSQWQHYA